MYQHQEIISDQDSELANRTGSEKNQHSMRTPHDRRVLSIKAVWRSVVTGRRKVSRRRANNSSASIVDRHEEWLFPMMLGVIILSVFDAFMTILLINNGAIEANPVMAFIIENNDGLFFLVKFTLTSIGVILIITLKNFTIFKYINGYHLIIMILSVYTCLIGYEITLLDAIINRHA